MVGHVAANLFEVFLIVDNDLIPLLWRDDEPWSATAFTQYSVLVENLIKSQACGMLRPHGLPVPPAALCDTSWLPQVSLLL